MKARPEHRLNELLERGLFMWLAAGGFALLALIVLGIALFSPRSAGSPQFGGAGQTPSPAPTGTPGLIAGVAAPTVETKPVPHPSDAADDIAIWVHPTDPSQSTVLGTDKLEGGGLGVYDLAGRELFFYFDGNLNNVDLRYNFPLGDTRVSLVGVTNRTNPVSLKFYKVDEADRSLASAGEILLGEAAGVGRPRGFTMYHSPLSGKYYAFVTDFGTNIVSQFELDGASGSVTGTLVRSFDSGNASEGIVTDDELRRLYVTEEAVGIWRYGAEPEDGEVRSLVDGVTSTGGHLTAAVKGTALYYRSDGGGYLIASSQGGSDFVVYDRIDNTFLGKFEIQPGNGVDGVSGQDGIDVTNLPLSDAFSQGLFVTQDHVNTDSGNGNSGNQNYKYVPWQAIANALSPALPVDTSFDPRRIGAPGAP